MVFRKIFFKKVDFEDDKEAQIFPRGIELRLDENMDTENDYFSQVRPFLVFKNLHLFSQCGRSRSCSCFNGLNF